MRILKSFMGASLDSMSTSVTDESGAPTLCIFGYGSLLWNAGFPYEKQYRSIAHGYSRRFYQGNITYRGTEDMPGRVVTLVKEEKSCTYGLVFKIQGWRNIFHTLEHLYEREIENGYVFRVIAVELLDIGLKVQALTCIALKENALFLGPPIDSVLICNSEKHEKGKKDESHELALIIFKAKGNAGPNYEYLLKLASVMRELFPHDKHEDLFQLESHVLSFLKEIENL